MINTLPKSLIEAAKKILTESNHPMIDVDGEMKHRHNSNGVPIHHTDEGIKNFHRWFGDSKVIDEHGRPMVAYHGTKNDIEKFDKRKSRTNKAFFFSPSPEFASSPAYTGHIAPPSKGGGNVMPVYLRIKSPKYVSDLSMNPMVESGAIESARSGGNDGIYVERGNYWIAMDQKSIKSTIGNNGDFHPKKPQINESVESQIHATNSLGMPIHKTVEGVHNFNKWFDGSKVKDDHGRPLVVYHGTNAHVYSGDEEIDNFHTNPESGRGAAFFTSNKSLAHEYGQKVYHTYLKLKNPLIIDAQGKHWSAISHNSPIKGEATDQLNAIRKQKHNDFESVARDMSEVFGDPYTPKEFHPMNSLEGHSLKHIPGLEHDDIETDQVVKAAKKNGFDGVIFHNVKDSPTNDQGYRHDTADVYAVFHPQHIKSTDNNGQFGTEWHQGIKE